MCVALRLGAVAPVTCGMWFLKSWVADFTVAMAVVFIEADSLSRRHTACEEDNPPQGPVRSRSTGLVL